MARAASALTAIVVVTTLFSCVAPTAVAPSASAGATATPATAAPTATRAPTPTPTVTPTAAPTVTPTATPIPAATAVDPGPAPYCAVADELTPNTDYDEHVRTYLDWTYAVPGTYVPPDLVSAVSGAPMAAQRAVEAVGAAEVLARRGDPAYAALLSDDPRAGIRMVAYADLAALRAAASAAGHRLVIMSAYRSYDLQRQTFEYWTRVGGYERALRTSARPGHSEHQLGTAIDFGDGEAAPWEYADWSTTSTGGWLATRAAEFGFVMSFPKGKTNVTCYDYEPWHYRWVGRTLALQLAASRLALREHQRAGLR